MKKVWISVVGVSLSVALASCAQMKRTRQEMAQVDNAEIAGSQKISAQDCNRGLFVLNAWKDWTDGGRVKAVARGYMTKEPTDIGVDPYFVVGREPRTKEHRKIKVKTDKFLSHGPSIAIRIGQLPPASGGIQRETTEEGKFQLFHELKTFDLELGESEILVARHPSGFPDGFYKSEVTTLSIPSSAATDSSGKALPASRTAGLEKVRSFTFGMSQAGNSEFAVAVPSDIENHSKTELGVSGTIAKGESIKIEINPLADVPANAAAYITVQFTEDSPKNQPTWRRTFTVPYEGQSVIEIPTFEGEKALLKAGSAKVFVGARFIQKFDNPDDKGGVFCIETGSGFLTTGKLEEKK